MLVALEPLGTVKTTFRENCKSLISDVGQELNTGFGGHYACSPAAYFMAR